MIRILNFLNVIAVILLLINWVAITDIIHKAENLQGEMSYMTISYIIILMILVINILFFTFKYRKKKNPEER